MIHHTTFYHNISANCTNLTLKYISSCQKKALLFTKGNPILMILNSDKTNLTVLMEKAAYLARSKDLLGDRTVYHPIRINPMKDISKSVEVFCTRLHKANIITKLDKFHICSHAFRLPQISFLPKIHKEGTPFWLLVDGTVSHLHYLAKFLFKNIKYTPHSSAIRNSLEFATALNELSIPYNHVICYFDVVSLFT